MTQIEQVLEPEEPDELKPAAFKGDVLAPEWAEGPSWFGYIGVGIAFTAMLLGIAAMIGTAVWWLNWMQS